MSEILKALELARLVHDGQTDKRGEPYIAHPLRVMRRFEDETLQVIALLHDVLEDSALSAQDLRALGSREEVVRAVDALSRRHAEDYFVYLERTMKNPLARAVKCADLEDNLDAARLLPPSEENDQRRVKYQKALNMIKAGRL